MLWGFVIVIKRNGTDGSTFPMVNEVNREDWSKIVHRVKSDLLRSAFLDEERVVTSESSFL